MPMTVAEVEQPRGGRGPPSAVARADAAPDLLSAAPLSHTAVLALQRSAGNAAVASRLGARSETDEEPSQAPAKPPGENRPPGNEMEPSSLMRALAPASAALPSPVVPTAGTIQRAGGTKYKTSATPQDNFAGRSTSKVGIGEVVDLATTITP